MILLRNLLFTLFFGIGSFVIVGLAPVSALFGQRAMIRHATAWTRFHHHMVRWILGIRVAVEGVRPTSPVLYAAKHQAMWETLELQMRLDGAAMVLKRELANIPVWGWAALRYGAIPVDREASAGALRQMIKAARHAKADGRSVLIFPEGTRVAPGETPPLKPGFAGLYGALDLPCVPIATDSGLCWPRQGLKRPGVITLRYGEAVPAGLPRREAEALIHRGINALERLD